MSIPDSSANLDQQFGRSPYRVIIGHPNTLFLAREKRLRLESNFKNRKSWHG
jgi:hypothetical protein